MHYAFIELSELKKGGGPEKTNPSNYPSNYPSKFWVIITDVSAILINDLAI